MLPKKFLKGWELLAKVLFDLRMWDWTGVGRYSSNLFNSLVKLCTSENEAETLQIQALINSKESLSPQLKELIEEKSVDTFEIRVKPFSIGNFFGSRWFFPSEAELFHIPHFTLPQRQSLPSVVTIHDLIPLRYLVMSWWKKKIYYEWNKRAIFQSNTIIAVSNFTADLIHQLFSIPFEKVIVIYEAPDPVFYTEGEEGGQGENSREPYFLAFASWRFHKGLDVLLKGFSIAHVRAKLLLVGEKPPVGVVNKGLLKLIQRLIREKRLVFTGRVEDKKLVTLYRNALAFIHPSREEGFGLPPLEAMATGVPVVSADISVSREVLAESAIYYPVENYQELSFTLEKVEKDLILRKEYASRSRERAGLFSWQKAAKETIEVYKKCLGIS